MNNSSLIRSWLLLILISVISYNSAFARELTSADLAEWFDPYNRSKISGLHDFMNSTDAVSDVFGNASGEVKHTVLTVCELRIVTYHVTYSFRCASA